MPKAREIFHRYKLAAIALAASAALHAAVFIGVPQRIEALDDTPGAIYSASLDPAALVSDATAAPVAARPRRVSKPRPKARIAPPPIVAASALPPPEVIEQAPPPPVPEPAPV